MIISPNDSKKYHTFTLNNGLRVLTIQDEQSPKSAVSLTVNCGHFDDPKERQGMAHFLEHMLFLGTHSYPQPGEYQQFIAKHGGSVNAWTGTEFTSFFFDINSHFLFQGLTRFSQFFTEPLFSQQYIEKERNAIDAEFQLKLKEDSHRIYQVQKETVNPDHPVCKFSVGNKDTLADRNGVSIRQELIDFHQQYYVAEHMCLVVLSSTPLDKQRAWINTLFAPLKQREGPSRIIQEPLYHDQQPLEIYIKPHKISHSLVACFNLPDTHQDYIHKTANYIAHLIGYEGTGSILSLLKRRGWCNAIHAGSGISAGNFKDFNVSFDLTKQGIHHSNEIIGIFYQYLFHIKQYQNHAELYNDQKKQLQLTFDFQEKTKPINLVSHLSVSMFKYKPEHYLYGDYIMDGFCQQEFETICQLLSLDNLRLIHINPQVQTTQTAKWYHTPYAVKHLDTSRLSQFIQCDKPHPQLNLPSKNPYLENSFILQPKETPQAEPNIIYQTEAYRFWFRQDQQFNVPKGHCYIAIDSAICSESIQNMAITRLFNELYLDSIVERHYAAELAGLKYHIYTHQGGMTMHISGLSANQHLLIEKLLTDMLDINCHQERFLELKQQLLTHWQNSNKSKPISQLFSILTSTLQPNNPTMLQLANALKNVSFEQFQIVRQKLFNQIHVEALVYGNWSSQQASAISDKIELLLIKNSSAHPEIFRPILSLQDHSNLAITQSLTHPDNAIVMYYQGQQPDAQTCAQFILLNHVMGPEFFHQLRTEKQLGYIVGTGFIPLNTFPGLAVYIQSPKYMSQHLHQEISLFFKQFCAEVQHIPLPQWQKIQRGLIIQVLEPDHNLRVVAQRYWHCIGNKDYQFNQRDLIAEHINHMTPYDLYQFAIDLLVNNPSGQLTLMTENSPQSDLSVFNLVNSKTMAEQLAILNLPFYSSQSS